MSQDIKDDLKLHIMGTYTGLQIAGIHRELFEIGQGIHVIVHYHRYLKITTIKIKLTVP